MFSAKGGSYQREFSAKVKAAMQHTGRLREEFQNDLEAPANAKCAAVDGFWASKDLNRAEKQERVFLCRNIRDRHRRRS